MSVGQKTVRWTCDRCAKFVDEHNEQPLAWHRIYLVNPPKADPGDDARAKSLDLCPDCRDDFVGFLLSGHPT